MERADARSAAGTPTAPAAPATARVRRRWVWLVAGAVLGLMAVHGRFDLAVAAWLSPVFLLRYVRTGPAFTGPAAVWAASAVAGVFWMVETAVPMTPITVLGVIGLGTMTVLPYAADRLVTPRAGKVTALLLFPAAMAACQFLMTIVSPFGTAFGVSAATQHDTLALLQIVAVTGPYGMGFLIGWSATVLNRLWEDRVWADAGALRRARAAVASYAAVMVLLLLVGGGRLVLFPPAGESVRVAGVSPDTSAARALRAVIGENFSGESVARLDQTRVRAAFGQVNANLLTRTREAAEAGAKIVVWSEQAANVPAAGERAYLDQVAALARERRIYLQAAAYVFLPRPPYAANRTYLFDPSGTRLWTYDKSHPIPGLEAYPPGPGVVPVVRTPYGRLATVTCFDADFPALARVSADIMLVPARDWAEIGPVHSQKALLRAVENGYSMIRQAEFGVSGAFDPQGRTLAAHDHASGDRHVVFSDVPTRGTVTGYGNAGDLFAWMCLAGTLAGIGLSFRRARVMP
ncbi:nitrilase-related carbon-nitrogen hydrolase [Spongiactinospora sp. 9N601]|uniref:nitrilase-related carbon-nitrogen hydrolase n=1 Tax=Spongiactinospora sp. 9N601 TaxID=3375149 RepID=UPI00379D6F59